MAVAIPNYTGFKNSPKQMADMHMSPQKNKKLYQATGVLTR